MKQLCLVSLAVVSLLASSCGNKPYAEGKTIVSVNGEKITEGDLNFLSSLNPNIARQLATPFGKKQIIENLVEQEMLYQASKKQGLDDDPQVEAKIGLYRKVILAQAFVEASATETAKKYYDAHPKEFEKLRLAHIMVRFATPDEIKEARKAKVKNPNLVTRTEKDALNLANKIYEEIKGGKDFITVAKEKSEDLRTKESGGDLGQVAKEEPRLTRVGFQPVLEKAFEMKVGEIQGPIKTTHGYHLITVTEPTEQIAFEEAKNQLLFKTKTDARAGVLAELKEKFKVKYSEGFEPETEPHVHPEGETHLEGEHSHDEKAK